jgi:catechol 2,3-dioxygenase-like lactoylglutathione lyase family enzyme
MAAARRAGGDEQVDDLARRRAGAGPGATTEPTRASATRLRGPRALNAQAWGFRTPGRGPVGHRREWRTVSAGFLAIVTARRKADVLNETMLSDARIMAIVPTTDIARAKAFYGETLGLRASSLPTPGAQVIYECGGRTLLEIYERPTAGDAPHTLASWEVSDVKAAVAQLRSRGVRFEEYDLPEVKTEDGISTTGSLREAWFHDPDGNTLRIHSHEARPDG